MCSVQLDFPRKGKPLFEDSKAILIVNTPPFERFAILRAFLLFDETIDFNHESLEKCQPRLAFASKIRIGFLDLQFASEPRQRETLQDECDEDDAEREEQNDMPVRKRLAVGASAAASDTTPRIPAHEATMSPPKER